MAVAVLSRAESATHSTHAVKWYERLVSPRTPDQKLPVKMFAVDQPARSQATAVAAASSSSSSSEPASAATAQEHCGNHELQRVFNYFDENGDGKISPSELRSRLREVSGHEDAVSQDDAKVVVELSDSDGDGLLGFEDFVKLVREDEEGERITTLREAFSMYAEGEGDGGGAITPRSLKRMLSRLGQKADIEQCVVMIGSFDLNGDGVINFDEFVAMMR